MDSRTVGTNWYGMVRGTDFWYKIMFGTVRVTEFVTKIRSGTDIYFRNFRRKPYRTEKNPFRYGFFRTKIRTTYRTRFESVPKSVACTVPMKIRTKNPYRVPKSVPVRIFGLVRPSMSLTDWLSWSHFKTNTGPLSKFQKKFWSEIFLDNTFLELKIEFLFHLKKRSLECLIGSNCNLLWSEALCLIVNVLEWTIFFRTPNHCIFCL